MKERAKKFGLSDPEEEETKRKERAKKFGVAGPVTIN